MSAAFGRGFQARFPNLLDTVLADAGQAGNRLRVNSAHGQGFAVRMPPAG
ncbi:hypothetical protein [Saccharothrix deserti]|nr:hypothetical protein [Saccharothrix deserti]